MVEIRQIRLDCHKIHITSLHFLGLESWDRVWNKKENWREGEGKKQDTGLIWA